MILKIMFRLATEDAIHLDYSVNGTSWCYTDDLNYSMSGYSGEQTVLNEDIQTNKTKQIKKTQQK